MASSQDFNHLDLSAVSFAILRRYAAVSVAVRCTQIVKDTDIQQVLFIDDFSWPQEAA